MNLSTPRPRSD